MEREGRKKPRRQPAANSSSGIFRSVPANQQHLFALGTHLAAGRAKEVLYLCSLLPDIQGVHFTCSLTPVPFLSLTKDGQCPSEMGKVVGG